MNPLVEMLNHRGAWFAAFIGPMLWQSAILICGLLALDLLLRKKVRATVRYVLWLLVLVKLVLPPSLALPTGVAYWLPAPPVAKAKIQVVETRAASTVARPSVPARAEFASKSAVTPAAVPPRAATPPMVPAPAPPLSLAGVLFAGWLVTGLAMLAWVCHRLALVLKVVNQTVAAPAEIVDLLADCRRQMGITAPVSLRCSIDSHSPAICGWFRPVIVIPASLPQTLGRPELRSILLHELAHLKRGDLWVSHVQVLLQVIYWFHPLVWVANAMIRRVREQAVDEMVQVELGADAEVYPATLVQVARLVLRQPAVSIGFVGMLGSGRVLQQRIRRLLNEPVPASARLSFGNVLVLAALALVVVPMGLAPVRTLAAAPAGAASAVPLPDAPEKRKREAIGDVLKGGKLTAEQAQELETNLAADLENLPLRNKLVGYYWRSQFQSKDGRVARQQHILWLIEHHPDAPILSMPEGQMIRGLDGSTYEQAKQLWLKQIAANPENTTILGNAAAFLLIEERNLSEKFLLQAQALEPNNPDWAARLAQVYDLDGNAARSRGAISDTAPKALEQMEKSQAGTADANKRFYNLDSLAKMAFDAGDMAKAGKYASEFIQGAASRPTNWAYGNAIHNGNAILGRIALREGRVADAKQFLLAAGNTKGSPQLGSFGPGMSLAKELLAQGEKETVLEYLRLCAKFWKMGAERLDRWTKEINAGLEPSF